MFQFAGMQADGCWIVREVVTERKRARPGAGAGDCQRKRGLSREVAIRHAPFQQRTKPQVLGRDAIEEPAWKKHDTEVQIERRLAQCDWGLRRHERVAEAEVEWRGYESARQSNPRFTDGRPRPLAIARLEDRRIVRERASHDVVGHHLVENRLQGLHRQRVGVERHEDVGGFGRMAKYVVRLRPVAVAPHVLRCRPLQVDTTQVRPPRFQRAGLGCSCHVDVETAAPSRPRQPVERPAQHGDLRKEGSVGAGRHEEGNVLHGVTEQPSSHRSARGSQHMRSCWAAPQRRQSSGA